MTVIKNLGCHKKPNSNWNINTNITLERFISHKQMFQSTLNQHKLKYTTIGVSLTSQLQLTSLGSYSLRFHIRSRLGQRHGHQSTTLTSLFCKNLYWKVIYVYFYESNFQDKSIYMIFTFSNSTTSKLFMIYIPNVWLKPCPKRLVIGNRRE
jgi:hypothetical protein